jgi:hypothetical protein
MIAACPLACIVIRWWSSALHPRRTISSGSDPWPAWRVISIVARPTQPQGAAYGCLFVGPLDRFPTLHA